MHQPRRRPLHRTTQTVEQLAHMAGMVGNAIFFRDDMLKEQRSPDARGEPIGHRPALDDVEKVVPLARGQASGTPTAKPLFESFQLMLVPGTNPIVDARAFDPEADISEGELIRLSWVVWAI